MFDGMGRIEVINLVERADRRREMRSELRRVGLQRGTFFHAIRPDVPAGFPTIGSYGCFLSHMTVLHKAADTRSTGLVLLEDDVDFSRDAPERFSAIMRHLKREVPNWGMFYGTHSDLPLLSGKLYQEVPADTAIATASFVCFNGWVLDDIGGYLLKMLDRPAGDPAGGPMHVDAAYSRFRREHPECRTFAATPALGWQRPSRTDVHERPWFDDTPIAREAASVLRSIRRLVTNLQR